MFLGYNELIDDTLFYIAENYYENFLDFASQYINQFDLIKSTLIKRPDFEELIAKIDDKIIYFRRTIERINISREENNLTQRDLSRSLKNISFDKNNDNFFDDIAEDIFEFENLNLKYFEKDKYETIKYFEMAIRKLTKIREKLTSMTLNTITIMMI